MPKEKPGRAKESGQNGLTQLIYEGLRDEITTGKLRPGERLSRRQIADRYGCSYTPVIEALVRLEHAGLVETEAGQMARVRSVSIETIQSIYALREAFETQAIRFACEMATPGEIDELYRLAEAVDMHAERRDERTYAADQEGPVLHWGFHKRIAEVSRCPVLVRELERIELLRHLQANWIFVPKLFDPPRHHAQLVDTIQARDPLAADAAMRAHVRRGLEKELKGYPVGLHV